MSLLALLALSSPVSASEVSALEALSAEETVTLEETSFTMEKPPRLPYVRCELLGMVWDGRRCVMPPCFPTGDDTVFLRQNANDLAGYHNETLANDYEVRGDSEITNEDAYEFLTVATDHLCADGSCDGAAQASYLFDQYGSLLGNSSEENLRQILQWDVEAGVISEDLGYTLLVLADDASSGLYSGEELQLRIDEMGAQSWKGADLDAVLTLQAVSRASYESWGGTAGKKIKPSNVVDGLTTVGCGLLAVATGHLEVLPAAGAFGGWASALYDNFFGRASKPSAIRWSAVSQRTTFSESVLIDGTVYQVQGSLSSKGGEVVLRDSKGMVLSGRAIKTTEELVDPASVLALREPTSGPRKIYIPIWTPWGIYIIVIEVKVDVVVIP